MGNLKLHGSPMSTNTMRVLFCLFEKELDFEFVHVNMATGGHKREPFVSLNPFGQVPALQDGDLKLFESRAITRYIAEVYAGNGTQLLHDGANAKAKAHEYVGLEVEAQQFNQPASKLAWEIVFKPRYGMSKDETVVKEAEANLAKVLNIYESRLSQLKYLLGEEFTLVDLHHIPNIYYLLSTPFKELFESRPHVQAWYTDIMARPAWLKVVELLKKN